MTDRSDPDAYLEIPPFLDRRENLAATPCQAKRDALGWACKACGFSWIDRIDPPPCARGRRQEP